MKLVCDKDEAKQMIEDLGYVYFVTVFGKVVEIVKRDKKFIATVVYPYMVVEYYCLDKDELDEFLDRNS